jgi:hypothetical protein
MKSGFGCPDTLPQPSARRIDVTCCRNILDEAPTISYRQPNSAAQIPSLKQAQWVACSGTRSEISGRMLKPCLAFPQILIWMSVVLLATATVLHLIGIKPKFDGVPAFGWTQLLLSTVMWCRFCVVRYEMWSTRQDQTIAGRED